MKNETLGSNVMSFSSSLSPDKEVPKKKKKCGSGELQAHGLSESNSIFHYCWCE